MRNTILWCRLCGRDYQRTGVEPRTRVEGECSWCSARLASGRKSQAKQLIRQEKVNAMDELRKVAVGQLILVNTHIMAAINGLGVIKTEGLKINSNFSRRGLISAHRRVERFIKTLGG